MNLSCFKWNTICHIFWVSSFFYGTFLIPFSSCISYISQDILGYTYLQYFNFSLFLGFCYFFLYFLWGQYGSCILYCLHTPAFLGRYSRVALAAVILMHISPIQLSMMSQYSSQLYSVKDCLLKALVKNPWNVFGNAKMYFSSKLRYTIFYILYSDYPISVKQFKIQEDFHI